MATNAGEVRIRLAAQSAEFKRSLESALAQMKTLQSSALQLNRILSTRITFPLTAQLRGAVRLLNQVNARAASVAANLPRQLPQSFTASIRAAQTQLQNIGTTAQASSQRTASNFTTAGQAGTRAFNQTGKAARTMSQRIEEGNRSVTLMVAKFALLTFAVQTVANIINSTFGAALNVIDDFEQNIIGTAAALTNIADLSAVPGATFGDAFRQNLAFVRGAFIELEQIAGDFLASATDLQQAFNALAVRGVVIRREEFRILGGIVDQIKLVTRGQSTSVQIAQELRNLFNGQVRASDQLAQLIRAQGGDVKALAEEVRRTGSLDALQPFIRGLLEAQGDIAGLLTSVREEFTATFRAIVRLGFADVFRGTVDIIEDINAALKANQQTIGAIIGIVFNRLGRAFQFVLEIVRQLAPALALAFGGVLARGAATVFGIAAAFFTTSRIVILIVAKITELTIGFDGLVKIGEAFFGLFNAGLRFILSRLEQMIEFVTDLISSLASLAGFPGLANFFGEFSVDGAVSNINKLTDAINEATGSTEQNKNSLVDFAQQIGDFFSISQKEIDEFIARNTKETAQQNFPTTPAAAEDQEARITNLQRRINDALRRLDEAEAARALSLQLDTLDRRRAAVERSVEAEISSAREGFLERNRIDQEETQARLDNLELRRQAILDTQQAQIANINASDDDAQEQALQIELLRIKTDTDLVKVNQELDSVQSEAAQRKIQNDQTIIENTRRITRLIQDQQNELENFAVQTVGESLSQLIQQQERQLADLRRRNPALTDADEAAIREGQRIERLQLAIEQPVTALVGAIDQAFTSIIDGLIEGTVNLQDIAQNIGKTLIRGALQDLIDNVKNSLVEGITDLFDGLGETAAQRAGQALAAGIGLLLAVISRIGNDASFTPGSGGGAGSVIESSQAVRGIIGGETSIAIAEINTGLQEALIPTNNILSTIERNTRSLAQLNLDIDGDALAASIQNQLNDIIGQALLQVSP